MEKLNLSEIERKLNLEFGHGTRIIFWYDADASFADSVDNLRLEDAIIYHLTETNAFRTKIMLEHDDTKSNYLIYAPFAKPSADKNHLEDTLRYSKEFYADKLSLIAADIRLPDRLQKSLYRMQKFFGTGTRKTADSAERTNQFVEKAQEMDLYSSEEYIIYLIAMCVLAKARNVTVDDLIYSVLAFGDIGEQEMDLPYANDDEV